MFYHLHDERAADRNEYMKINRNKSLEYIEQQQSVEANSCSSVLLAPDGSRRRVIIES